MVKVAVCIILIFGIIVKNAIEFMHQENYQSGCSMFEVDKELYYIERQEEVLDCESIQCSSNKYTLNVKVPRDLSHVPLYNILENEPPLTCKPSMLGYSKKQAGTLFPPRKFNGCENKAGISNQIIHIDTQTSTLYMTCPGYYYLGSPANNELIGRDIYTERALRYKGPVKLPDNIEWAYGSCESPDKIQGATYNHYKNQLVIDRVKKQMMIEQEKAFTAHGSTETNPTTVILLVLDSISRESFYRNLPQTQSALNSLSQGSFKVFDFKTHNAAGDNSIVNQFPTWTGFPYNTTLTPPMPIELQQPEDLLSNSSIWSYLKSKGWATLFGAEFCNDYFSRSIGRKPDVDHIMTKFWCAGKYLEGFDDMTEDQRCIGNKDSHYYLFNYTLQYVKNYKGINKWAHLMSVAAHEGSGSVISTLDNDLAMFLTQLAKEEENLVVFITADHGMRYKEWYKKEEGRQEHLLPMMFLLASDRVLSQIQYAEDSLLHNSDRLVSKIDLFYTQKFLATVPYYRNFQHNNGQGIKKMATGFNLLQEKIPNDRSCQNALIPVEFCSCNQYTTLDYNRNKKIANGILKEIVFQINQQIITSSMRYGYHFCSKIEAGEIISFEWIRNDEFKEYYKMSFIINHPQSLKFSVFLSVFAGYMKRLPFEESYDFYPIYTKRKEIIRILGISTNYTDDLCEELQRTHPKIPDFCVCKSVRVIQYNEPLAIQNLQQKFRYVLSNEGENCIDTCGRHSMHCSRLGLKIVNTCKAAMEYSGCYKCIENSISIAPALDKYNICIISHDYQTFSCDSQMSLQRICACEKVY